MSEEPKFNVLPYSYEGKIKGFLNPGLVSAIEIEQGADYQYHVVAILSDGINPAHLKADRVYAVRKIRISPDLTYEEAREMAAEFAENCF